MGDIQAAFNAARSAENAQLGLALPPLTLPSQAEWDALSPGERALWLINRERQDRGVDPLHGVEADVTHVAQTYAQYLLDHNAFSHTADGRWPWERMEANPAIGACHDFLSVAENLAAFATSGSWIPLPVERSVYMWLYEDADHDWAHRHAALWYPYTENSGPSGREGFLGMGLASGGPYQGWNQAALVVMNVFDPCATWEYDVVPAPSVTAISPAYGVNTGALHVEVSGSGFQPGATVRLGRAGQADIVASDVAVVGAERITCNLNLDGAATGAWDVLTTNPDQQIGVLAGGLTVTLPSGPMEGAAFVPLVVRVQGAPASTQRLVVFEGFSG
ncbi:MAG: hypothetical protein JXA74_15915 [Anaerolineae bacterium]|nr:hypothetical protein [Anaerolineae bacterium]